MESGSVRGTRGIGAKSSSASSPLLLPSSNGVAPSSLASSPSPSRRKASQRLSTADSSENFSGKSETGENSERCPRSSAKLNPNPTRLYGSATGTQRTSPPPRVLQPLRRQPPPREPNSATPSNLRRSRSPSLSPPPPPPPPRAAGAKRLRHPLVAQGESLSTPTPASSKKRRLSPATSTSSSPMSSSAAVAAGVSSSNPASPSIGSPEAAFTSSTTPLDFSTTTLTGSNFASTALSLPTLSTSPSVQASQTSSKSNALILTGSITDGALSSPQSALSSTSAFASDGPLSAASSTPAGLTPTSYRDNVLGITASSLSGSVPNTLGLSADGGFTTLTYPTNTSMTMSSPNSAPQLATPSDYLGASSSMSSSGYSIPPPPSALPYGSSGAHANSLPFAALSLSLQGSPSSTGIASRTSGSNSSSSSSASKRGTKRAAEMSISELISTQVERDTARQMKRAYAPRNDKMSSRSRARRRPDPCNTAKYFHRMDVLEEVADIYSDTSPMEIMHIIDRMWLTLSPYDRKKYEALEVKDQERFNLEAKKYLPKSAGGTMKRPKKKKHPNAPKHPKSAYLYFVADHRAQVKKDHPTADFTEVARKLGEMWRACTGEQREGYEDKATIDKTRYRREKLLFEPALQAARQLRLPLGGAGVGGHPNAAIPTPHGMPPPRQDGGAYAAAAGAGAGGTAITAAAAGGYYTVHDPNMQNHVEIFDQFGNFVASGDASEFRRAQPSEEKRRKPDGAPKHPLSGYLFFVAHNRSEFNEKHPGKDFTEVAKLLGEHWKTLTTKEKRKYEILAAADKKRYEEEKERYQPQPASDRDVGPIQMPKKPLTAYSFWAHDERLRWVQANPNVDKRDLTRHLRTKWNNLSPDEKAVYNEQARADKMRYRQEVSLLPKEMRPKSLASRRRKQARLALVSTEVLQWTANDVGRFVVAVGLHTDIGGRFEALGVNGNAFVQLSDSKLKERIGILNPDDRRRICLAISILSL